MKSKPVYGSLALDPSARRHLFVVQGHGRSAARRALESCSRTVPVRVLYMPSLDAPPEVDFEAKAHDDTCVFPDQDSLMAALVSDLQKSGMETAFYVAGPEMFLWKITNHLRAAGVEQRRIQQDLAGSQARRVYCVHCRTMNERVTATVHRCVGCGTALMVRDHFSRPLGAYMGVIIDAESPGDVPEPEMLYV